MDRKCAKRILDEARKAVKLGYHQSVQQATSLFQRELRRDHISSANEEIRAFEFKQEGCIAEQKAMLRSPSDADQRLIGQKRDADLDSVFVEYDGVVDGLANAMVKSEGNLREFEDTFDASGKATPSTMLSVATISVPSTAAESLVSVIALGSELGIYGAFVFGLLTSFVFFVPAVLGGIGFAKEKMAKLDNSSTRSGKIMKWLATTFFCGFAFISTHYRAALLSGADNVAQATFKSILDAPAEALFSIPLLAFLTFVFAIGIVVARKFGDVFVWRELRRLRLDKEATTAEFGSCRELALTKVDEIGHDTSEARDELLRAVRIAADQGAVKHEECRKLAATVNSVLSNTASAYVHDEHGYRTEVMSELRAEMLRAEPFDIIFDAVTDLDLGTVKIDPDLAANERELSDRLASWKEAHTDLQEEDANSIKAAIERINIRHENAEAAQRRRRIAPLQVVNG